MPSGCKYIPDFEKKNWEVYMKMNDKFIVE